MNGYVILKDGVRLFYETVGNGPQTILIPNGFHMLEDFRPLADGRTLIFYDVRNRGQSDASPSAGGIQTDVLDLEEVRMHFGIDLVCLIGHSYIGVLIALYAMKYPERLSLAVLIGPPPPNAAKEYSADLAYKDGVLAEVFGKIGQLPKDSDPVESCRKFWSILRSIYVADSAHAQKIHWDRCHLPNELNFMKYWTEQINPSLQKLNLSTGQFNNVTAPVLIVHGKKDRSAPYGGGLDWAAMLPNARLLTVENAAHAPWIEAPEEVFRALTAFLNGGWPDQAALAS